MKKENLKSVKWGVILSLLTLLFGFSLGGTFGAAEDNLKDNLKESAQAVMQSVYQNNQAAADKIIAKSWVYYKRAHLHANGLGTTSLIISLLLSFFMFKSTLRKAASTLFGLGALGYSIFWLLAGYTAPGLGSTHAAKEALSWLAFPSSMFCFAGLLLTIFVVIDQLFLAKR